MKLILGDSLDKLKTLEENSVDSVVTDPPYGLSFMGKKWDYDVPSVDLWKEVYRVLKPGGHLLSFAGSRTYHRMAVNIEDAGFEIRDQIMWVYGSGFPKSHNIGKAVDKLRGTVADELPTEPMITGTEVGAISKNRRCAICKKAISSGNPCKCDREYKANNEHNGWGTALKPAHEPIVVARKPLSEKTIAQNVLKWGTGGINIDGCRVKHNEPIKKMKAQKGGDKVYGQAGRKEETTELKATGRFPANFIHDGSDEVVGLFPETKSGGGNKSNKLPTNKTQVVPTIDNTNWKQDSGSAARFFFCAKASKSERNKGLEGFEKGCTHPTVKPLKLMQYLVRLVTPPQGTVLDPFMGSGSTGIACKKEDFDFIGIELEEEYLKIAQARIDAV